MPRRQGSWCRYSGGGEPDPGIAAVTHELIPQRMYHTMRFNNSSTLRANVMDQAIQTLLDKQAIYELSCRYMRGLDRLDADMLLSVFWEDAYCEYGFINGGAPTFIVFAISALRDHVSNQHMIGNTLIEVEGDEAFGEVYFHAYHKVKSDTGFDDLIVAGRYLDRYERRDGVWKMAYRSERVDWSRTTPTQDPYYQMMPDSLFGGRLDDAVYDRTSRYKTAS